MSNKLNIIRPTSEFVKISLKNWDSMENATLQESSLKKLFFKTYPLNTDLDDVLIKVAALNDFYSTKIYRPVQVAKNIVSLNIDQKLKNNDLSIVNKIALVKIDEYKSINYYSFATKYCSHHKPETYPIYDSYVDKFIMACNKIDKFDNFKKIDLKNFERYHSILMNFRDFYDLQNYTLKEVDRYLWQAGKEHFPRTYSKSTKKQA